MEKRDGELIMMASFTEAGIRNVKDTVKRVEAFEAAAKKHGCKVTQIFWTHGQFDSMAIVDAPDEAAITAPHPNDASLHDGGNAGDPEQAVREIRRCPTGRLIRLI